MVWVLRARSSWAPIPELASVAARAAVLEAGPEPVVVAEQRHRAQPHVWPMPLCRRVRFEDRAVHCRIKAPMQQLSEWQWRERPPGDGMESSGFPPEPPLRRRQRRVRRARVAAVVAAVAVRPGVVEVEAGRLAPHPVHLRELERLPQHLFSRYWMDSNPRGPRSHWPGVNWISMPLPVPGCRHNRSPYTTNCASWKVRKQRMAWVIAPR